MNYENNPEYEVSFTSKISKDAKGDPLVYYKLKDISGYHLSRYVAANAQNIYSESGITKPLLGKICEEMIKAVNNNKLDEVAVWINNIKARMNYPVDENAAIRMAMIYHFVNGEKPDTTVSSWTEYKVKKVMEDPEAYAFFLPLGLIYTPTYSEYLEEISENYLEKRSQTIRQLTPQPHQ